MLGEAESPEAQTPDVQTPPPPRRDYPRALEGLLKKHGYKAGYILIAEGALALLAAAVMLLMVRGFFSAANSMMDDPWGGGYGVAVEPDVDLAPNVSLSPEEWAIIEDAIRDQAPSGSLAPAPASPAVPTGIQMAFYAIPILPAIVGLCLIAAGIWVVVKYRPKG